MQYRTDNISGNRLSALGFGCMRFPGSPVRVDQKKAERLIVRAVEGGVNYFDAAYIYPGSEAALGSALSKNGLRDKVYIATKLPVISVKEYADFDRYFSVQLERLKTDYIDYYLLHMLTSMEQFQKLKDIGIEKWIAEKKACGAIRRIGFSFHGRRGEFTAILDAYDWEFCQIQYNYININYQAGVTGLKKAAEKGIPVIVMEPLLGGRLASGLPKKAVEVFKSANPGMSPAAWAFKWLYDQPEVTVVLSGMANLDVLEENLAVAESAAPGCMTEEETRTVGEVIDVFNKSYKIPCTGCNYCMPCPKNIDIPGCFTAYNTSYVMGRIQGFKQHATSSGAAAAMPRYAGNCVSCGKCLKHCPQNIPIPENMKKCRRRLEPWYFKFLMKFVRMFLGGSKKKKKVAAAGETAGEKIL